MSNSNFPRGSIVLMCRYPYENQSRNIRWEWRKSIWITLFFIKTNIFAKMYSMHFFQRVFFFFERLLISPGYKLSWLFDLNLIFCCHSNGTCQISFPFFRLIFQPKLVWIWISFEVYELKKTFSRISFNSFFVNWQTKGTSDKWFLMMEKNQTKRIDFYFPWSHRLFHTKLGWLFAKRTCDTIMEKGKGKACRIYAY